MFSLACVLFLTAAMLAVILLDARHYVIPNTLNLAILMVYAFAAYFLQYHFLMSGLAAVAVLAVGLGLFALGLMGGGDIKLLVVLTLWTGWSMTTVNFLLYTAMFGGLLVFLLLALRGVIAPIFYRNRPRPRILTHKEPMPYGIAIAVSFLVLLWTGEIPALVPPAL